MFLSLSGMEGKITCSLSWPVIVNLQLVCLWERGFITTRISLARPLVWHHPSTTRCLSLMMVSFSFLVSLPLSRSPQIIFLLGLSIDNLIMSVINTILIFFAFLNIVHSFWMHLNSFWWKEGNKITRFVSPLVAFSLTVYFTNGLYFILDELWL